MEKDRREREKKYFWLGPKRGKEGKEELQWPSRSKIKPKRRRKGVVVAFACRPSWSLTSPFFLRNECCDSMVLSFLPSSFISSHSPISLSLSISLSLTLQSLSLNLTPPSLYSLHSLPELYPSHSLSLYSLLSTLLYSHFSSPPCTLSLPFLHTFLLSLPPSSLPLSLLHRNKHKKIEQTNRNNKQTNTTNK